MSSSRDSGDPMPLHWNLLVDTLSAGGAQRQLVNLANGLVDTGDRVRLTYYRGHDVHYPVDPRVELAHLRCRGPIVLPWNLARVRRLLAADTDTALSFLSTPSIATVLAAATIRRSKRPTIITSQRGQPGSGPIEALARVAHRLADFTVCNARSTAHGLAALAFAPQADAIVVIPNGVEATASKRNYRAGSPLRIATAATVRMEKGPLQLAEALTVSRTACHVRWAGSMNPKFDSNSIVEQVGATIDASNSQWEWLGHLDQSELHDLYQWADVLIHPSQLEALPNGVCEALETGLPAIITDSGDTASVVPESSRSLVCPPGDIVAISRAIDEYAQIPATVRQQLGEEAQEYIRSELSTTKMVTSYRALAKSTDRVAK